MFDFVTSIWASAQRVPASVPPPEPTLDDRWKVAGKSPARERKACRKRTAKAKQPSPPVDGADAVVLALIATCRECGPWRMLSVTELADAMHCSVGEASKRVKQTADVDGLVWTQRRGRHKMVGLHRVSRDQWPQIVSSTPAAAVGLYRIFTVRVRTPSDNSQALTPNLLTSTRYFVCGGRVQCPAGCGGTRRGLTPMPEERPIWHRRQKST